MRCCDWWGVIGRGVLCGSMLSACSSSDDEPMAMDGMSGASGDSGAAGAAGSSGQGGTGLPGGTAGMTSAGGSVGSGGSFDSGGAFASGGAAGTAGSSGGEAAMNDAGDAPHAFSIVFDSSLDTTGWFDDPAVQTGLRAGADLWAERILDDFEEIPEGTPIMVRNLDQVDETYIELVTDEPIDDLLIFVACSEVLDGLGVLGRTRRVAVFPDTHGPEFQQRLQDRWQGTDQEPWVVGIAFGCQSDFFFDTTPETSDDLPSGQSDFISLVAHEVGHALGIGASQTYRALLSAAETEFLGEEAVALYGEPVPLEDGGGHILSMLMHAGGPVLMDLSLTVGTRVVPTELDFAFLSDIGYEIAP